MTSERIDPLAKFNEPSKPTAEKPDILPLVTPPKSPQLTAPHDESPVDDDEAGEDGPVVESDIVDAVPTPQKKRRRKSIRLAALWCEIGCWKISQTFRRFPGWTSAALAAGLAVILSLMLLSVHFFWGSGRDDQKAIIAQRDPAGAEFDKTTELGEATDDDEFFAELQRDNDDGPSPVNAPTHGAEPDDAPFDALSQDFKAFDLDIQVSTHLLAGQPDEIERFEVSSQEFFIPDEITEFSPDELAAVDPLWQPVDALNSETFNSNLNVDANRSRNAEDDVISVSKNFKDGNDALWKDVNGKRPRLTSSDEASPLLSSLNDMQLVMEPFSPDLDVEPGIQNVVSGWEIRNDGAGTVEVLMIENQLPAGLLLRKGVWKSERFEPSDWQFINLASNSTQTVAFTVHPEPASDVDGFSEAGDPFEGARAGQDHKQVHSPSDVSHRFVETTTRVHLGGAVSAETRVDAPHLQLTWSLPERISAEKMFVIDFEIENTGVLPVEEVRIEADLGAGLLHRYGKRIKYQVGLLESGQKFKCQMFLTAPESGRLEQQIRLTGGNMRFQQENLSFEVHEPATAATQNQAERL